MDKTWIDAKWHQKFVDNTENFWLQKLSHALVEKQIQEWTTLPKFLLLSNLTREEFQVGY